MVECAKVVYEVFEALGLANGWEVCGLKEKINCGIGSTGWVTEVLHSGVDGELLGGAG